MPAGLFETFGFGFFALISSLSAANPFPVTLVFVVWRNCRAGSEPLTSQRFRFSRLLGFDGPGRTRTCDLGIKSPGEEAAAKCEEL